MLNTSFLSTSSNASEADHQDLSAGKGKPATRTRNRGAGGGDYLVMDQRSEGPRLHPSSEHWALGPQSISLSVCLFFYAVQIQVFGNSG